MWILGGQIKGVSRLGLDPNRTLVNLSLVKIKIYSNRQEKTENLLTDDQESKLIKSFFENGDKCNLTEVKWDAPIFEWSSLIHANCVIELLDLNTYKKHIVSVHGKRKPVKCLICDVDISLKSNSIKHIFRRCLWKERVRVLFDLLVKLWF